MNTCPKCHRPINEGNSPNLEECHAGDYDDDQQCELSSRIYQLRQFYIAGRDMHDSVTRFLDRYDNLPRGHEEVINRIEQMRRDLPKWHSEMI